MNLKSRVLERLRARVWDELNTDVLVVWEQLGGGDDSYVRAYEAVMREKLALTDRKRLAPFWSTIRSFFNEHDATAERWIAGHPEVFEAPGL